MGFNYLQTDDRDDYFDSIGKKRKEREKHFYDLINKDGEKVLIGVSTFELRRYAKKHYIPYGTGAKKIWRKFLTDRGYIISKV
jgi:hypothetical protein